MGRSRPPTAVLAGLLSVGALTVSVPLPGAPLTAQAFATSGVPRITISFHETPMSDVLRTFAGFADRSIVAGPLVEGSVTADIRNQPWDTALREILRAHGLSAVETEAGIIRVGSEATLALREEVEEPVVRIFRLRWQRAMELEGVVASILSERGSVRAVASTNSLVVRDVPRIIQRVAQILGHDTAP